MSVKTLQELCTRNIVNNFDTNGAVISIYDLGDKVCLKIFDRLMRAGKINDSNIERLQLQGIESLKINGSYVDFSDKICCWLADIILAGLEELDVRCKNFDEKIAKVVLEKYEAYKKSASTKYNNSIEQDASDKPKVEAALRILRIYECVEDKLFLSSSGDKLPRMFATFANTLEHLEFVCNHCIMPKKSNVLFNAIGMLCLDKLTLSNFMLDNTSSFTVKPSMQTLKLHCIIDLTDQHVLLFLEVAGKNIQHLGISNCYNGITDSTLQNMQLHCPNLVSLDLSNNESFESVGLEMFFATASLTKLQRLNLRSMSALTDNVLQNIQRHCPNLVSLDLSNNEDITATGLDQFFATASLTKLQILSIGYLDAVSDNTLQQIQLHCPNLVSLDLSRSYELTPAGLEQFFANASLTKLQRLSLREMYNVSDAIVAKLAVVGQLKYIDLWGCNQVSCQSLSVLSSIPTLKYVGLDCCDGLDSKDVEDFMTCNGLVHCFFYDQLHADD